MSISKNMVKNITPYDYHFNDDIIFKLYNNKYIFDHKAYSIESLNKILLNSNYNEVVELAKKARKKYRNSKICLISSFSGIPIFFIGFMLLIIDGFKSDKDGPIPNDRSLVFFGSSVATSIPLIITSKNCSKKGKKLTKIALEKYNQAKLKND
ncbi:MAG: hypothetical protein HYU67_03935 [Flavobacteriia bacterium]|nr:hypothetical protein [Flavobacteriia bacterium]